MSDVYKSLPEFNQELDAWILALGERIQKEEAEPAIIDPVRFGHMQFAERALRMFARGENLVFSYELHKPFTSMGYISVEGDNLHFDRMEWFCRIAEFADNTEIYPLTNGRIRMSFTFHGLAKGLKVGE